MALVFTIHLAAPKTMDIKRSSQLTGWRPGPPAGLHLGDMPLGTAAGRLFRGPRRRFSTISSVGRFFVRTNINHRWRALQPQPSSVDWKSDV